MAIISVPDQPTIDFPTGMDYKPSPGYDDKVLLYDPTTGKPVYTNVEDFVSASAANVVGSALPTDSPSGTETVGQSYRVGNDTDDPVTFANFLDKDSAALVVPAKTSGLIIKNADGWAFVPNAVDLSGLVAKGSITNDPTDTDPAMVLGAGLLPVIAKDGDFGTEVTSQLFDKSNIRANTAVGSVGNIVTAANAETTQDISIPDGQSKLSWSGLLASNTGKKISFYKSDSTFISNVSIGSESGTCDIPVLSDHFNVYYKVPLDAETVKDSLMLNFGATPLPYQNFKGDIISYKGQPFKNTDKNFIEEGQAYLKAETYSKSEVNALQPNFGISVFPGANEFDIATMTKTNVNVSSVNDYGIANITGWAIAIIKLRQGQKKIAINGWNSVRTELGIGTLPVPASFATPFNEGLIKSGNATHMGFVKTNGTTVLDITTLVEGVNSDIYLYITIKNATESSSVYDELMISDSDEPLDFVPYGEISVVDSVDEMDIAAKKIIGSDGSIINTDNIATRDQISLNFKEIKFDGDIVKVRTIHNAIYDLVQSVSLKGSNNGTANILAAYLIKKSEPIDATTIQVTANGDATAPIQYPNTNSVGINNAASNHGLSAIKLVTDVHGKDSTDILSVWTDGTWEYVLVAVIDPTHLLMMSKPQNIGGEMLCKIVNTLSPTLTNVSGGTHTDDITGAAGSDAGQFPMVKNAASGLRIDGIEITNPGTYQGNKVEIYDYSEPIDPATVVFQNPMVWNDGNTLAKMTTTYKFFPNGVLQMDCLIDPVIDHSVRNFGFIQLLKMTVTSNYNKLMAYMNGINSFVLNGNTYDFKAGVNITGTIDSMTIVGSQLEDINTPPSRQTQILFDTSNSPFLGTAHGYNTLVGQGKDSVRKFNTQYWFINGGIQKSYPYGFAGLATTGVPIYGTAYFVVFDPNKNDLRADYYYHQSDSEKVYILETSKAETKRSIILQTELTGKQIEILDQSAGITLFTPDYVQAQGIVISAIGAGEFIKLKLS